jgi:hypothetical protein
MRPRALAVLRLTIQLHLGGLLDREMADRRASPKTRVRLPKGAPPRTRPWRRPVGVLWGG